MHPSALKKDKSVASSSARPSATHSAKDHAQIEVDQLAQEKQKQEVISN